MKKYIPAFLLTFVNVLGFTVLIPVLPFLVEDFGGDAFVYGLLLSTYSASQFVGSPVFGRFSDRLGRRVLLFWSQVGTFISWLIFGLAYFLPVGQQVFGISVTLVVIFISRVVDGLTGGNISVTVAYISDLTSKEDKSKIFGINGAVFGLGFIIGPGIGGLVSSGVYSWFGVVVFSLFLSFITLVAIYFWLPESLTVEKRNTASFSVVTQINLWKKWQQYKQNTELSWLIPLQLIVGLIMAGYTSVMALVLIHRFGFDEAQIGLFLLFVGTFVVFNQGVLVQRIVRRLGDVKTLFFGLFLMGIGLFGLVFPQQVWLFVVIYYLTNLGFSLVLPTLQSMQSNAVSESKQGEIMGFAQSVGAFCAAIMPAFVGFLFLSFTDSIFWLFSALAFFGLVVFRQKIYR